MLILASRAVQVAVFLDHQRVHFQQGQVVVLEQLRQADEDMGELLDLVALQAQLEGQLAAWYGCAPTSGSMVALRIFSGVSWATFSISTPLRWKP